MSDASAEFMAEVCKEAYDSVMRNAGLPSPLVFSGESDGTSWKHEVYLATNERLCDELREPAAALEGDDVASLLDEKHGLECLKLAVDGSDPVCVWVEHTSPLRYDLSQLVASEKKRKRASDQAADEWALLLSDPAQEMADSAEPVGPEKKARRVSSALCPDDWKAVLVYDEELEKALGLHWGPVRTVPVTRYEITGVGGAAPVEGGAVVAEAVHGAVPWEAVDEMLARGDGCVLDADARTFSELMEQNRLVRRRIDVDGRQINKHQGFGPCVGHRSGAGVAAHRLARAGCSGRADREGAGAAA
jgi:hypothetical protein